MLTGLEVRSPEGHRVTRRVLEAVPLEHEPYARLHILPTVIGPDDQPVPIEVPEPGLGRPVVYGPDHYRRVAEVYRLAEAGRLDPELDGKPRLAVMRTFGLPKRTAARHIAEARRLGVLPPKEG